MDRDRVIQDIEYDAMVRRGRGGSFAELLFIQSYKAQMHMQQLYQQTTPFFPIKTPSVYFKGKTIKKGQVLILLTR
jgi:hypothetical protein